MAACRPCPWDWADGTQSRGSCHPRPPPPDVGSWARGQRPGPGPMGSEGHAWERTLAMAVGTDPSGTAAGWGGGGWWEGGAAGSRSPAGGAAESVGSARVSSSGAGRAAGREEHGQVLGWGGREGVQRPRAGLDRGREGQFSEAWDPLPLHLPRHWQDSQASRGGTPALPGSLRSASALQTPPGGLWATGLESPFRASDGRPPGWAPGAAAGGHDPQVAPWD